MKTFFKSMFTHGIKIQPFGTNKKKTCLWKLSLLGHTDENLNIEHYNGIYWGRDPLTNKFVLQMSTDPGTINNS